MKNKKGFSLIELIAVVIILGVIMLIAIPNISKTIEESRKKTYVETANRYVDMVRTKVSSGEIRIDDPNVTYYISYDSLDVEHGGNSPYGEWISAYVVAVYDSDHKKVVYYWTSIDETGHKILLKNIEEITIKDIFVDTTLSETDTRRVGLRENIVTMKEDGTTTESRPVLSYTTAEADVCYTYFVNEGGTITIESYNKNCPKDVEIPSKIDGLPVTVIGGNAFYNEQLTSVILPEGLTTINGSAFRSNQITKVVYPYTLTSIGGEAFAFNRLTEIALKVPATLGSGAYTGNLIDESKAIIYKQKSDGTTDYSIIIGYAGSVTELVIPPSHYDSKTGQQIPLKTIASGAFRACKLTSVDIPDTVTRIESSAFQNNKLTEVDFPDGLQFIGNYSFSNNQLKKIEIPDSVITIEDRAFTDNRIPKGASNEFVYARKAKEDGDGGEWDYTRIGSYAGEFDGTASEAVKIPEKVGSVKLKTIGGCAFIGCGLVNISIPTSVTSIGNLAFTSNLLPDSQAFIYQRDTDGKENKKVIVGYGGAKRSNIVIPEGVEELGTSSFAWSGITSVTFPDSLKKIGSSAFSYNKLTEITIPKNVETIDASAFLRTYPYGPYNYDLKTVHNLTKNAFNWKAIFGGRYEATFDYGIVHNQYGDITVLDH